jgi:hypothetical protein
MRGVLSLPEYTTVLGQTFSICSRFFAAATRAGDLAIWRTGQVSFKLTFYGSAANLFVFDYNLTKFTQSFFSLNILPG